MVGVKHDRRAVFFGYALLTLLLIKMLAGCWHVWDLKVHDGAQHFIRAMMLVSSGTFSLNPEWQPLYIVFYSLFHRLFADPLSIDFAHRIGLIITAGALLYTLLRRLFSPTAAFGLAAYALLLIGHDGFMGHQFVLIPLLLMLLFTFSNSPYSNAAVFAGGVLMAFTRPEYVLMLPLLWGVLLVYDYFAGRIGALVGRHRLIYAGMMLALLAVSLGVLALQNSLSYGRSWDAFQQHYALGLSERYPQDWLTRDPWVAFEQPVKAAFGDAPTIGAAFRNNPAAFLEHIGWNFQVLGKTITKMMIPVTLLDSNDVLLLLMLAGIALLCLLAIIPMYRLITRRLLLKNLLVGTPRFWLVLLASILPAAASWVIVYPRPGYMVNGSMVFMLVVAGIILQYTFQKVIRLHVSGRGLAVLYVVVLVLFPSYLFVRSEPYVRDVLSAIPDMPGTAPYYLVGDSSSAYCLYHDAQRCLALDVWELPADAIPDEFIQTQNIRVIVSTERLLENTPPVWEQFWQTLPKDGWYITLENRLFTVYVRLPPDS